MVKEYKFVNDFRGIPKGSIMTWDEKQSRYVYRNRIGDDTSTYSTYFAVDSDTACGMNQNGYITAIKEDKCNNCGKDKLDKVKALCADVITTQSNNLDIINEKYNNGEVPSCVKLETETVHYNLVKVLNRILDIINE